jgi:type IV secretory system conjugative DNA transfer VirD4/TraG family protein
VYVLQSRAQLAAQLGREEAERVWSATELKIVGPTSDLQLARDIAALSGERRVHYTRPRRHDEIIGQTGEDTRHLIRANEITGQQEGEFILIHRGCVEKYRVPSKRYHHAQAKEPPDGRPRPHGVAEPESYRVPPMIRPDEALEESPPEGPAPRTTFRPVSPEMAAAFIGRLRGEGSKTCPYCEDVNDANAAACKTCKMGL